MDYIDDLAELAMSITDFAASKRLTIIPAVPEHDYGPEVRLGQDEMTLPEFLELTHKLGGGVLYLRAVPFDPASGDVPSADPPAHLISHKGQTGQVAAAFAANGIVHFWEHCAAWHAEWQELTDRPAFGRRGGDDEDQADEDDRLSDEERARLAAELADAILADPRFRAARGRGDRNRAGQLAIPPGTDRWAGYDAVRLACERADDLAQERYDQIMPRLDDLAAELLASEAYQQASSAAARRQAAERFLIPHADGFGPPTVIRDELYARAQRLTKTRRDTATGLF